MVYSLDIVGSHLFPQTPHAVSVVSAGVSAATRPGILRGRWHHLHHGLGLLQWGGSRRGPCRGLSHGSGRVRHLHTDKSHYLHTDQVARSIKPPVGSLPDMLNNTGLKITFYVILLRPKQVKPTCILCFSAGCKFLQFLLKHFGMS